MVSMTFVSRPVELLLPSEMSEADRRAIAAGPDTGMDLMRSAGQAVADALLSRFPGRKVDVLCGPGNNGGDGYVVAERLRRGGIDVVVHAARPPRDGSDAAIAAAECEVPAQPLATYSPREGAVVVDALYGAGLDRPLDEMTLGVVARTRAAGSPVVAVDLPSGLSGATGQRLGDSFDAALTVTFARLKPGHLLEPGRTACGEVVLADIGISDAVINSLAIQTFENGPALWRDSLPRLARDVHKYSRGHVMVLSGGASATGAARLSAMAAARAGAGAVTLLSPPDAVPVNAAHLTSVMLREVDTVDDILAAVLARRPSAFVYGPGLANDVKTARRLARILQQAQPCPAMVVDASALTALGKDRTLLEPPATGWRCDLVLTPHAAEFARLFPDLDPANEPSKLARARSAASRAQAVVVYKGPDTVIAAPDGRAAINSNGTPLLATAGSGDVLSGIIAGLLAQGMPPFEAAGAGVWMHAEAARRFGYGLIAEDLPLALRPVLSDLLD